MIVIRKRDPDEVYLSIVGSSYLEFHQAKSLLIDSGIICNSVYMPNSSMGRAIAVLRLAGFTVEVSEL